MKEEICVFSVEDKTEKKNRTKGVRRLSVSIVVLAVLSLFLKNHRVVNDLCAVHIALYSTHIYWPFHSIIGRMQVI